MAIANNINVQLVQILCLFGGNW